MHVPIKWIFLEFDLIFWNSLLQPPSQLNLFEKEFKMFTEDYSLSIPTFGIKQTDQQKVYNQLYTHFVTCVIQLYMWYFPVHYCLIGAVLKLFFERICTTLEPNIFVEGIVVVWLRVIWNKKKSNLKLLSKLKFSTILAKKMPHLSLVKTNSFLWQVFSSSFVILIRHFPLP